MPTHLPLPAAAVSAPPGCSIQVATTADAGELLTVQRSAFVSEAQAYGDPFLPPLTQTLDELVAELGAGTCLKAVVAGRIVGSVRASDESGIRRIGRLAVAPDQQGQGLGTALLQAVEALAGPEVIMFTLFTGADSSANLRLYRRLGYHEVRREALPTGPGLIHLQKPRS